MNERIVVGTTAELLADVRARVEAGRVCFWFEIDGQHFVAHTRPAPHEHFMHAICECGQVRL